MKTLMFRLAALAGVAFATLLHPAAAQDSQGQWHVSPDGTGLWQYLNLSNVKAPDLAVGEFDGLAGDDLFYASGGAWFFSSAGTGQWQRINTSSYKRNQLLFGDFDGNGLTDVFRANGERWFVSFDGRSQWTQVNTSKIPTSRLAVGNFVGDARADIFYGSGNDWFVSDGGVSKWSKLNGSNYKTEDLAFGNFNGDGRTDVFRATGSKWFVSWGGSTQWQALNTSAIKISKLAFADMTGDGNTDVFYANGTRWFISESGSSQWRQINTSKIKKPDFILGDFAEDDRADVFHPVGGSLFRLRVIAHDSLTFTDAQAQNMMNSASVVLSRRDHASLDRACPIIFRLRGNVGAFSAGNGIINNRNQFTQVDDFGAETKIVNQINWCGNVGTFAGCANVDADLSQVITRAAATGTANGVTLAHEFGHNQGLNHPDQDANGNPIPGAPANRVMNSTGGANSNRVVVFECGAMR